MVFDRIEHAPLYYGLGDRFRRALEWMARVDPDTLTSGEKVVIDGDDIFATLFRIDTLPREQSQLEGHRNYADIQFLLSGQETVGYAQEGTVPATVPYDSGKDIGFWNGDWDTVTVHAGEFYIVWPQDLHAPRVACGSPAPVTRLVIKVRL